MPAVVEEEGSQRLPIQRQEIFAQARARGSSNQEAWQGATRKPIGDATARNSGSRCARRPHVAARIAYLQRENATQRDTDNVARKTPVVWMQEVCQVLRDTAEAFDHLPLQKRSKLKNLYGSHLARLQKMEELQRPAPQQDRDPVWKTVVPCRCQ